MSGRRLLALILVVAAVRGVIYALLNPPFGSPDERSHFQYIASIATGGASGPRGVQGHQPIGYYVLMAPAYWLTTGQVAEVQLLAVRLLSVPMLLGQLLFAWLAARKLAPARPEVAIVATGFLALIPQNTLIGASANNDNAANLAAAALVYLSLCLLIDPRPWHAPVTAAVMALGLLAKGQILPLIALTGVILLAYLLRTLATGRSRRAALWLLVLPLIALPVFSREGAALIQRTGWVLATLQRLPEALTTAGTYGSSPFAYQLHSFWGAFLGEAVHPNSALYLVPLAIVAVGLAGRVGEWVSGRVGEGASEGESERVSEGESERVRDSVLSPQSSVPNSSLITPHSSQSPVPSPQSPLPSLTPSLPLSLTASPVPPLSHSPTLFLVAVIVIQWLVVFLIFLQHVIQPEFPWKIQYMQGRYLFPMLLPLALLVAEGWSRLATARHLPAWYPVPIVAALALFDASALSSLLMWYSWPG